VAVLDHQLDEVCVVRFEGEVGAEVGALEEGVSRAADRRALLEEEEALAPEFFGRDLSAPGEAVRGARDERQLVLEEFRHL
jgi:hypothetical protein